MTTAMLAAAALTTGQTAGAVTPVGDPGATAWFEGRQIDLADGWGDAQACHVDENGTRCYRTEAEMDLAEQLDESGPMLLADCASSVRLYDGTSYGTPVVSLTLRGTYINLSAHSFDNKTSSYKIGACSSSFFDGTTGGAPQYPGATTAGASATSMASGWNNRVSSIYIF
ncbi:MAG TPA: hypothetical protein VNQ73_17505 [Ilumatobacter sp.]|nr:hypothetical protein [Ilumatobacter sp.]